MRADRRGGAYSVEIASIGWIRATDVSPDGRWALAFMQAPQQLMLYPTGPGQARRLDYGEFQAFSAARSFPDGERVLVCGNEPGRAPRCYVRHGISALWLRVLHFGAETSI